MGIKKGVVLFIVEGPSDYDALIPYIEQRLLDLKIGLTVKVMHGDILTKYTENQRIYAIFPSNVKGELKKYILKYLSSPTVKNERIKSKDIRGIYYVTDTDYCFHSSEAPSINKKNCLEKIFYFNEMELLKDNPIPFKTIYFSKHLEHVLKNKEKNLTDKEKQAIAIEFADRSLNEKNFFVNFFRSDGIKKWETYLESYKNIEKYRGRACNMNNFLDELEKLEESEILDK